MSKVFRFLPSFKSSTHAASRSFGSILSTSNSTNGLDDDQRHKGFSSKFPDLSYSQRRDTVDGGSLLKNFQPSYKREREGPTKLGQSIGSSARSYYAKFKRAIENKDSYTAWQTFQYLMEAAERTKDYKTFASSFSVYDFNAILRILRTKPVVTSRVEKVAKIEQVLAQMKLCNVEANVVTYVTVMAAYSKLGNVAKVKSQMDEMRERGLCAESQENILLDAYVHGGDVERAKEHFQLLRKSRNVKLVSAYNIMMQAAAGQAFHNELNGHRAVKEYYDQMVSVDMLEPDQSTLDILIDSFSKVKDVHRALELINMKRERQYPVTTYEFNSLLRMYSDLKQYDMVDEMFRVLLCAKVRPDHSSFFYAMACFAQRGDAPQAVEAFAMMPRYRVVPNVTTYALLSKAIGPLRSTARFEERVTRICEELGLPVTQQFILQLITGYLESGDADSAQTLQSLFLQESLTVSPLVWEKLCSLAVHYDLSPRWILKFWSYISRPSIAHIVKLIAVIDRAWTKPGATPNVRLYLMYTLYKLSAQMHRLKIYVNDKSRNSRIHNVFQSFVTSNLSTFCRLYAHNLECLRHQTTSSALRIPSTFRRHSVHEISQTGA